jgi:hypothetical protein
VRRRSKESFEFCDLLRVDVAAHLCLDDAVLDLLE